jgi:hypothetical protein
MCQSPTSLYANAGLVRALIQTRKEPEMRHSFKAFFIITLVNAVVTELRAHQSAQ